MACDESVFTRSERLIQKEVFTENNFKENPNPFLFSQSLVV